MQKGSSATVAILGIVGLIIGGSVGYAMGANNSSTMHNDTPNPITKSADLRVTLNQILRQHVALATVALKDAASGSPDADAAVKALDNNSVEIANAVGSVYGNDAKDSFLKLWRNHIGFFVNYTQGKVAGDEAKMAQAKTDISGYTEEAATFFSKANSNIDKASLKESLAMHGDQVFAIVDAYAAKDYTKASDLEEEAYNHMGETADTLAGAIVKQYPNKF